MSGVIDFSRELIETARSFDVAATPFLRSLDAGTCDRKTIAEYALNLAALAKRFPRVLASVYAICPNGGVRRSLLANLREEKGHPAMARRLALAAGVDDRAIDSATWSAPRFGDLLQRQEWLGAFAWMSVGIEANVPGTFALVIAPLKRHYGFADDDLAFLTEHLTADERHGSDAAKLIAGIATTDEMRAQALEGARLGAAAWWLMHRKCGRHGA